MTEGTPGKPDPLTAASNAVAVVIALNKPIYPLYVWFLAPAALKLSFLTALLLPVYVAIPFIARRSPLGARITMIAAGTIDTLMIGKIMGEETGAWLFGAACLALCAVSFYESEKWHGRVAACIVYVLFVGLHHRYGAPFGVISPADADALFTLNLAGALALIAFIALRFPRRESA